jgi:ATP-dependent RNA helicase DDX27
MEDDETLGDSGAVKAAIRSAKKAARPAKIGATEKRSSENKSKNKQSGPQSRKRHSGGIFGRDFEQTGGHREGVRAKKGDVIGGMSKKGGKRKRKA